MEMPLKNQGKKLNFRYIHSIGEYEFCFAEPNYNKFCVARRAGSHSVEEYSLENCRKLIICSTFHLVFLHSVPLLCYRHFFAIIVKYPTTQAAERCRIAKRSFHK